MKLVRPNKPALDPAANGSGPGIAGFCIAEEEA